MKPSGWIFMALSWGTILWMIGFSYYKILKNPAPKKDR